LPPVSVIWFDAEAAHAQLPPDHRHAHDFLVLVYVEEGGGSFAVDGAERPLRAGETGRAPVVLHGRGGGLRDQPGDWREFSRSSSTVSTSPPASP